MQMLTKFISIGSYSPEVEVLLRMFEKVSRSLNYDSNFFLVHKNIIWTPAPITLPHSRCACGVKSTETRDELSTTCNPKVMSRYLSAPDATSLHHCLQNHRQYFILSWIQALDTKRPVASLGKGDLLGICHLLSIHGKCSTFPASWVHGQSHYCISHTLLNCEQYQILRSLPQNHISFSCLFLRQWCSDVASGADRHLDITFGLQVVEISSLVSVLLREVLAIPTSPFFHLLVQWNLSYPVF